MPKYHVTCHVSREVVVQVEANNPEEAATLAQGQRWRDAPRLDVVQESSGAFGDWNVWEVREVP